MHPLAGIHPEVLYPVHLNELQWELKALREAISEALFFKTLMLIPDDKVEYLDEHRQGKNWPKEQRLPPLFGPKVHRNFKSSRNDVAEAGNCFAMGRYTACVFHCMRVLEKGLHALVHDLNNKFNANITFSRTIEETNWGNILDEVENTVFKPNRLSLLTPRPTSADMTFYSKAAKEFEYFKDAWRNDVSHSRSSYSEGEAKAVIEHVGTFMRQIAVRLKE